jgi:hypothetical protein
MVARSDSETGYRATSKAVLELQQATKELVQQQAYMQGVLDALRAETSRLKGAKGIVVPPPPPPLNPKVTLTDLPSTLKAVVQGGDSHADSTVLAFTPAQRAALAEAEVSRTAAIEAMRKHELEKEAAKQGQLPPGPPATP